MLQTAYFDDHFIRNISRLKKKICGIFIVFSLLKLLRNFFYLKYNKVGDFKT